MKLTLAVANVILASLAAATPLSSPNQAGGLEDRGSCKYDNSVCCKYQDGDYKPNGYGYPSSGDYKYSRTIYVKYPKKIQDAIDDAHPGDKIIVGKGTYSEQLTIKKDGIQLIGRGAILVPPTKPVTNDCSGLSGPKSQTGICVVGYKVKVSTYITEHVKVQSVKKLVSNVVVTGFHVRNFSGVNIAVVGGKNALISKNRLSDAGAYGGLTIGSVNTHFDANKVDRAKFGAIGICMDNKSGVLISNNKLANHFVGICVQTNHADIQYNKVWSACFGIYVDAGTDGAKIRYNKVGKPSPICAAFGFDAGIIIDGATNTKVLDNTIVDQKIGGRGTGVVIQDNTCAPTEAMPQPGIACITLGHAAIASGNVILRNTLSNNDYDFFVDSKGKNVIACNPCKKSIPESICKAD
ncbi:pectin lyase fold/virulence factor [Dactylonectria estremocensis]|uniref:Pectin lyase fold/virulence factor n=1 Tax=Dactylonectria estremocensis TaxID=1079267 RepID=A0A9P9J1B9_9HYPO|nr:pectin lyase fold/virulence factor [Dactylonectria estremocensis]